MNKPFIEQRTDPRAATAVAIELVAGSARLPASLTNLSRSGMQARIDPDLADVTSEITALRLGDGPELAITVHWGLFDGRFGASFKDQKAAATQLASTMAPKA